REGARRASPCACAPGDRSGDGNSVDRTRPAAGDGAPVTVAVVGLGAMGSRIAGRLLDTGHDVVVWNRTVEKAEPLVERGATPAVSPADAANRADALIIMVGDPAALESVAHALAGTTVIQMSTVGPAAVERLVAI